VTDRTRVRDEDALEPATLRRSRRSSRRFPASGTDSSPRLARRSIVRAPSRALNCCPRRSVRADRDLRGADCVGDRPSAFRQVRRSTRARLEYPVVEQTHRNPEASSVADHRRRRRIRGGRSLPPSLLLSHVTDQAAITCNVWIDGCHAGGREFESRRPRQSS
jgi:hypothetical protein